MPDWTSDLQAKLSGLRLTPEREADIRDELGQHLDDRYADLTGSGTDAATARRLALDELDDDQRLRQRLRPLRQARAHQPIVPGTAPQRFLADLLTDVTFAFRLFRKQPSFTAAVVVTLGLGVGANTAVFGLVNATLFAQLPVRSPNELAYVYNGRIGNVFSYPAYVALRDAQTTASGLAAWGGITASLNADGETDLVSGVIVTGNFFDVIGTATARGRLLSVTDDVTPGGHPVAVISERLWTRRFGRREDIIGHDILLNGQRFTIVGVTEPSFIGPQLGAVRDLYVPMMMQAVIRPPRAGYSGEMNPDLLRNPDNGWLFGLARLNPTHGPEQASRELGLILTNHVRARAPTAPPTTAPVVPVGEAGASERREMQSAAWLLTGVAGVVLLIACVNVANLLQARGAARAREMAVRLALGASRTRMLRQLLVESMCLALLGGAAGVALAWLVVLAFEAAPPSAGVLVFVPQLAIDRRVLFFALGLSVATVAVFGLLPAWAASRAAAATAMKEEGATTAGPGRMRVKRALAVIEVAASLMLLLAGGLFVRSLQATYAIDPGIETPRLLSAPVNINLLRYTRAQGREFYQQALDRVSTLPGVESTTLARVSLLLGGGRVTGFLLEGSSGGADRFVSEGARGANVGDDMVRVNVVSAGFFRTMGISRLGGRDFAATDVEGSPPVTVLSEAAVGRYFPGGDPIGRRVSFEGPKGPWVEVVGVVRDSNYTRLGEDPAPVAYLPLGQNHETGMMLYVRTSVSPTLLIADVRRTLQALEPNLPLPNVQTLEQTISASLYAPRMGAWLLTGFGVLALVLATVGVYGVLAFAASRRAREFGIRIALGASAGDVFRLVLGEGLVLVLIGVGLGTVGGAVAASALTAFLYGVSAHDPLTFVAAVVALVVVASVACAIPAARATRADPLTSLRME